MLIDPSDCRHAGLTTRAEKKPKLHASWPPGPQSSQRSTCSAAPEVRILWVVGGAKRYGNELNWTARQALYPNGALLGGCFAQNPAQLEKQHRTRFLIRWLRIGSDSSSGYRSTRDEDRMWRPMWLIWTTTGLKERVNINRDLLSVCGNARGTLHRGPPSKACARPTVSAWGD